jgi:class 3 adenylate cyclase
VLQNPFKKARGSRDDVARVEARALPGEILVTGAVQLGIAAADFDLVALGSDRVKGKATEVHFFAVNWNRADPQQLCDS